MKKVFILTILALSLTAGDLWSGNVSLGSYLNKGNVDKFDLKFSSGVSRKDSTWETSLYAKAEYGESEGIKNNQALEAGIKADYKPFATISPFVLATAYNNEFKDIDLRLSGYLGAKYTFYATDRSDLSISAAFRFDWEDYVSNTESAEKYRISIRPKFSHKLWETTTLEHVTFLVLDTGDFEGYLVDSKTSIKNSLTDRLALKILYELDYDNDPPTPEIEKADHGLSIVLELSL